MSDQDIFGDDSDNGSESLEVPIALLCRKRSMKETEKSRKRPRQLQQSPSDGDETHTAPGKRVKGRYTARSRGKYKDVHHSSSDSESSSSRKTRKRDTGDFNSLKEMLLKLCTEVEHNKRVLKEIQQSVDSVT